MAVAVGPPHRTPTYAYNNRRVDDSRKYFPYLWLSNTQNHEEIQIGLNLPKVQRNLDAQCDGCSFVPFGNTGSQRRMLYYCLGCGNEIFLCEPCARVKIRESADYHKADHQLKPWQPSLLFDRKETLTAPNLNVRHSNTVSEEQVESLCTPGVFHPPETQQSRSVRCFLPTPNGRYYVRVRLEIFFDVNAFQRPDMIDRTLGKAIPKSQSLGGIRMLGKSLPTASKSKPRNGMTKWVDCPIQNTNEPVITKDVALGHVVAGPADNTLEVIFQDHYYMGEFIYERPFTWRIIGITLVPDYAPKRFATKGELLQAASERKQEQAEERQNRAQQFKDFMEDRENSKEKAHGMQQHGKDLPHQLGGLNMAPHVNGRPQNGWYKPHIPQEPNHNAFGGKIDHKVKPIKRPMKPPRRPIMH